jgi:hypothetical protein
MTAKGDQVFNSEAKNDSSSVASNLNPEVGLITDKFAGAYGDTQADLADMQRLGKKQEFNRNFNLLSTLGFISIYMATWEFVLVCVVVLNLTSSSKHN